jgi:hypothetical protein
MRKRNQTKKKRTYPNNDDDDDDDNNNNNNNNINDTHPDRCGNIRRQKSRAKGSSKEDKIQEFRYTDATNVEPEMYGYTSYDWRN